MATNQLGGAREVAESTERSQSAWQFNQVKV